VVEFSLMVPWIVFLFIGVLDTGFYYNAVICTKNAARVAALQASLSTAGATDSSSACVIVLQEMAALSNVYGLTSCGTGTVSTTAPLSVIATLNTYTGGDRSTLVTVNYLTVPVVAIPGVFPTQMTITSTAEAPVRN
jgi:TadE-like protein